MTDDTDVVKTTPNPSFTSIIGLIPPCETCDENHYMMWPLYPCPTCRPQVAKAVELVRELIESWPGTKYGYDDESLIIGVLVKAGLVGEERGD